MRYHYYEIRKEGANSYLKQQMLDIVLQCDRRMMGSYNRHGCEQNKVVQVTCDERYK